MPDISEVKLGQSMNVNRNRKQFRESVFARDDQECIVPWCDNDAVDAHHVIEREVWDNEGYIPDNGASVCEKHHKYAEENHIPPQSFWMWIGVQNPPLPKSVDNHDINKWGDQFDTPPWQDLRERIKYPSSRHLLPLYWYDDETVAEDRIEQDDTGLESVKDFVGIPLVITEKMDGSNCMLVNDLDTPVRARNGSEPLETMKPLYRPGGLYWQQEVNEKLPERLQVFGEWLYAKHSIHYGCDCEPACDDVGPKLSDRVDYDSDQAYFQIFGVYDKELNIWLSWPETEQVADELGFPTTPVLYQENDLDEPTFSTEAEARQTLIDYARDIIDAGGEGIVVRSKFPYHYAQFGRRVGKYVRENHVTTDEHWSHGETTRNII